MTETAKPTADALPSIAPVKLAELPAAPTRGELSDAEKAFAQTVHDAASKPGAGAQLGTDYDDAAAARRAANRFARIIRRANVIPAGKVIRTRATAADGGKFRVTIYYGDAPKPKAAAES